MSGKGESSHLLLDVVKGVGRVDREADQNDVRVRVRERTETVVVFLTSRIPKSELNMLSVDLDIGDVVLEDSGDVHLDTSRSAFGSSCMPVKRDIRIPRAGTGSVIRI